MLNEKMSANSPSSLSIYDLSWHPSHVAAPAIPGSRFPLQPGTNEQRRKAPPLGSSPSDPAIATMASGRNSTGRPKRSRLAAHLRRGYATGRPAGPRPCPPVPLRHELGRTVAGRIHFPPRSRNSGAG